MYFFKLILIKNIFFIYFLIFILVYQNHIRTLKKNQFNDFSCKKQFEKYFKNKKKQTII